jgi:hypothetical protein
MTKGETCLALNFLVPGTGLEPARLAALDPKSSASANSAIPAIRENCIVRKFLRHFCDVSFTGDIVALEYGARLGWYWQALGGSNEAAENKF